MKYVFKIFFLVGCISGLQAGQPTLETILSVGLRNGETVTLYGDKYEDNVLYFLPTTLRLGKRQGRVLFDLYLFRGITHTTGGGIDKLNGGVADAMLELGGAFEDLGALRDAISDQYPAYAEHRLAMVPVVPGSASIAISQKDPLGEGGKGAGSGGPVSCHGGVSFPVRFPLSTLDAQLLSEKLIKSPKGDAFTAAFDAQFTAIVRMDLPATSVTIMANERSIYDYVEQHFQAKGGFFMTSFHTDIRKVREKLMEDKSLTIEIDNQNPNSFSYEQLNALADRWLQEYVLTELRKVDLSLPDKTINHQLPGSPSGVKQKFFSWGSFSGAFSRVKLQQNVTKKVTFTFRLKGVEEFPIYAKADFSGLSSDMVTLVDLNHGFSAYGQIAIIPPPHEVLTDPAFGSLDVYLEISDDKEGKTTKRMASFNRHSVKHYQGLFPLLMSFSDDGTGGLSASMASKGTFSYTYRYAGGVIEEEGLPFQYSHSENDLPNIDLTAYLSCRRIGVNNYQSLLNRYPNLIGLTLTVPNVNGRREVILELDETSPSALIVSGNAAAGTFEIGIVATYEAEGEFKEVSSRKTVSMNDTFIGLKQQDIPGLIEFGK
jgi:hypothetical protein